MLPKGIPAGSEGSLGPIAGTDGLVGPLAPGPAFQPETSGTSSSAGQASIFYSPQQLREALQSILGPVETVRPSQRHLWVYGLLLVVTLLTTTVIGAGFASAFQLGRPFDFDLDLKGYQPVFESPKLVPMTVQWALDFVYTYARPFFNPHLILLGLPYSLTLMTILLSHELGHFFACLHHRVDATPPAFLPAPTLIGTFGAFIRIHSPIYTRRALFDIGISGPIAGFLVLVPALVVGVSLSKVVP
ncbi:MAG: site-2 protease family protein, partial [Bryobacteraceae bacterium]